MGSTRGTNSFTVFFLFSQIKRVSLVHLISHKNNRGGQNKRICLSFTGNFNPDNFCSQTEYSAESIPLLQDRNLLQVPNRNSKKLYLEITSDKSTVKDRFFLWSEKFYLRTVTKSLALAGCATSSRGFARTVAGFVGRYTDSPNSVEEFYKSCFAAGP